jgi:F-type H+-transporting ATPase subunit a
MGEETTLIDLLPGVHNLKLFMAAYLQRDHFMIETLPSHFSITHVLSTALVLAFVALGAFSFKAAMSRGGRDAIVPPGKFSLRLLFEMFADTVMSIAKDVMGEKNARKYIPVIGTLACFIFFSNVLALIPGMAPPTAVLKTNVALALTVFVLTHVYGVRENGLAYFKHFLGPVWWLAPLMLPIELVSHIARPVSLSIRLAGNISADHKVVAAFFALVPFLLPVPFLILGVLVAVVQTLVFSLLTMVYIQGAIAHEHDHGDDAQGHHHYDGEAANAAP